MSEKKVNNWEAANELERFKQRYSDPLKERITNARNILTEKDRVWPSGDRKRAEDKLAMLETTNLDYQKLHDAVNQLIKHHEAQTTTLTELYTKWYNNISVDGDKPLEMMGMQIEIMQELFRDIYEIIEPLKLDLKPPK
jgi:RNase adaptor protein for sRNA GlmZ degradation